MRKFIAILLIIGGILGILLTFWEFRFGSWLLAVSGNDIPYGQFIILGIASLASLIGGIHLYKNRLGKSGRYITKLILNLGVLSTEVGLVYFAYKAFTHKATPMFGALSVIGLLVLLWFLMRLSKTKRFRYQRPGMVKTSFVIIILLAICAFAGVQPLASYKDTTFNMLDDKWTQFQTEQGQKRIAEEKAEVKKQEQLATQKGNQSSDDIPTTTPITKSPTVTTTKPKQVATNIRETEELAFMLINAYREDNGIPPTVWDERLYKLSKAHTEEMARRGELFHGSGDEVGENAWGGKGYSRYSNDDLAIVIVRGWVTSPLHNAWLLHAPIKESVVSIVVTPDGQYASWSFWMNKLGSGPELVTKISREWKNSGSNLDWIPWLKSKGYID